MNKQTSGYFFYFAVYILIMAILWHVAATNHTAKRVERLNAMLVIIQYCHGFSGSIEGDNIICETQ